MAVLRPRRPTDGNPPEPASDHARPVPAGWETWCCNGTGWGQRREGHLQCPAPPSIASEGYQGASQLLEFLQTLITKRLISVASTLVDTKSRLERVCLRSSWVTPSFSAVRATSLFCSSLPRPWLHPLGQGCSQSPHAPSLGGVLHKFPKPSAASPLSLLPPQPVLLSLSTVPEPQPVPKPLPRRSSLPHPSPADTAPFPKPSAPCPQQPAPPQAPLCRGHPAVTAALGRDPRLPPRQVPSCASNQAPTPASGHPSVPAPQGQPPHL